VIEVEARPAVAETEPHAARVADAICGERLIERRPRGRIAVATG